MELLTSQIAQLQDQLRSLAHLAEVVARQGAQLEAHALTIARLSSENEAKDVLARQLETKIFPEGC